MALVSTHRPPTAVRRLVTAVGLAALVATTVAAAPASAEDSAPSRPAFALASSQDSCLVNTPPDSFDLSTERRTMVYRLYCSVFLRLPDQGGFDYWVDLATAQGLNGAKIADQFITSTEFVQRYGSLEDHQFLDLVYRNVLGRPADAPGYAYWDEVMTSPSFGRRDLMLYFSDSEEFRGATQTATPRPVVIAPPVGVLAWLPSGMSARQAADAELATGTFDLSLCSGYGGQVSWFTPPYEMRWCVNMDAHFDQVTIDGVYVHEAIHARVGALFANRNALTPTERTEVTRVAIQSASANEGLADFWAMRLVPGYEGSPAYADYVFNNEIWDAIFAKYPIGGALPG